MTPRIATHLLGTTLLAAGNAAFAELAVNAPQQAKDLIEKSAAEDQPVGLDTCSRHEG